MSENTEKDDIVIELADDEPKKDDIIVEKADEPIGRASCRERVFRSV